MFTQPEDRSDLDLPTVDIDDIDQEVALLQLQGKRVKRQFVAKRLAHQEAIFSEVPMGATPLWSSEPLPDPRVTDTLIDWAFTQSETIADATFDFLDYPTDEGLQDLLSFLKKQGISLHKLEVPQERSLTQMVMDALQSQAATLEELAEIAREFFPSKRPEAAIRQITRRLIRNGQATRQGDRITLA